MDWRRPFGRRRIAAPETKDSRAGPLIALTGAGRARWTPRDYAHLGVGPEGFWRLSLKEWRMLTGGPVQAAPLGRGELERMKEMWPDD
ncbi:phage tail assembly chaperone [Brevundimonas pondensis]|uniref:Phage tail assembly chaperone n=1 Tax=Brevundimonas pondensis TaxID=2774189 RepID=A0ABX7SH25_9CAUL|nr:phage tail assembly chaperone [Brevundimonas pondensis]QTC86919.1 phage tail assembly chaperone [Brevundimonas pondensis]